MAGGLEFDIGWEVLATDPVSLEAQGESAKERVVSNVIEFPAISKSITLLQDARNGCGGHLWNAALYLTHYLTNEFPAGYFKGKRCIELGSGTGIVGICLALLGAEVIMTDLGIMLDVLKTNVQTNLPSYPNAQVKELCWGEDHKAFDPPFEVVIASEVIYLEECFQPLLITLRQLANKETLILIAHQHRRKAEKVFFNNLKKFFSVETIPRTLFPPQYQNKKISVFKFKKLAD
eukprot:TRINITY_DN6137_c0_g1_i1.p1 TRINITY_DN6137_c0_g1~~TRINITY_DN6137_c0_g1_i1.p1  ORF type:complete len:245 (+),score=60.79 TRINITY_DN6137_c0_g1_i1:36-737(+)